MKLKKKQNSMSWFLMKRKIKILVAEDDSICILQNFKKIRRNLLIARNGLTVTLCKNNRYWHRINGHSNASYEWIWSHQKIREFNEDVIIITQSAFVFTDEAEKQLKLVVTGTFQNQLIKSINWPHQQTNNQIKTNHKLQCFIISVKLKFQSTLFFVPKLSIRQVWGAQLKFSIRTIMPSPCNWSRKVIKTFELVLLN
jgi:hypothetical protein